ncbi:E3 ubiquitin/ISG15 ligase TRIM25-like [Lithobates pipiens]
MASADLREDLHCSICLNIYMDPVTLRCGHNFCRVCMDSVLDTQEGTGVYSCPECRARYMERPALIRNVNLRNVAAHFLPYQDDQEEPDIVCTYCIQFPVPAVKSCLLCEASLCDKHLKAHNMSPEHIITEPTASLQTKKCSVHKELLKYYCIEDASCICATCRLDGEHQGHPSRTLDEASGIKKKSLTNVLQKLIMAKNETEKKVKSLQEYRRTSKQRADEVSERVMTLFRDIRRQQEDLERRVLSEISRQKEQLSLSILDMIQQLEKKKDELSRKLISIEELCKMTDPLTLLQESDRRDLCDIEEEGNEDNERHDKPLNDGGDLDVTLISHTLHTGLCDIIGGVNVCFYLEDPADILLDADTANSLLISDDRKIASWSGIHQRGPERPGNHQTRPQVLSSNSFSSGKCYWEVDVRKSVWCRVGMCYPHVDREGFQSRIGDNDKSWCLDKYYDQFLVRHDNKDIQLPNDISTHRFRIYLDYESGQLSFYELCDPIRHLHTFTTTFTGPLHVASWVWYSSCIQICGMSQQM